eukprot:SM000059S18709  [mRNA]  locus=s59:557798:561414:- [translate_table: standard]
MGSADEPPRRSYRTPLYLCIYIALSSSQIFFNKWILSEKEYNFPYPVALTLLHMIFSTVLCFLVVRVFKLVKLQQGMTFDLYMTSVVPIGATFALTLWLGNTAYLYISVAFSQMLKAGMPVAVYFLGILVGLEALSGSMLGIMSLISGGVMVASYGEINFNSVGVVYQLSGIMAEAARLILAEILVKRKGLKLDPITMMYYVSPCRFGCCQSDVKETSVRKSTDMTTRTSSASVSAVCLLVPWLLLEQPHMNGAPAYFRGNYVIMILNSVCTFALNISVFLVIIHTSALTIRVAGVIKDWIVVLISAIIFADTKLTRINIFGYAVAVLGVALYNRQKTNSRLDQAPTLRKEDMLAHVDTSTQPAVAADLEVAESPHGPTKLS